MGDFSDLMSIYCRYYSYISGKIILLSENKVSSSLYKYKLNPLIIYKFEYSIIIEVDSETDGFDNSFIIISTLNFGLQLEFFIEQIVDNNNQNNELLTINFYNDKNYIYHIYKLQVKNSFTPNTYIKKIPIIPCLKEENITLSDNTTQLVNFTFENDKFDINFLINNNILLDPSRNYYSYSDSNKKFEFKKGSVSGVFDNYYIYSNSSNAFSLICQINITSCFSLCQTCTPGKEGTPQIILAEIV